MRERQCCNRLSYRAFHSHGVEVDAADGIVSVTNAANFPEKAYEGLLSARSGDGKVRGTKIAFPDGGPSCKYAALFDERSMFDNLRKAFLLHAGTDSKPTTFLACLEIVDVTNRCRDFAEALRAWVALSLVPGHPLNFGRRAWPAYLHGITRS